MKRPKRNVTSISIYGRILSNRVPGAGPINEGKFILKCTSFKNATFISHSKKADHFWVIKVYRLNLSFFLLNKSTCVWCPLLAIWQSLCSNSSSYISQHFYLYSKFPALWACLVHSTLQLPPAQSAGKYECFYVKVFF